MSTFSTIVPIFAIIFLGWFIRARGHFSETFRRQVNRLVYYLAIPAMIFRALTKTSLYTHFNAAMLMITLGAVALTFGLTWLLARGANLKGGYFGTFVHSAVHGNIGYIGLAVTFYHLGEAGLLQASIIAGFLMILQNFIGVFALSLSARGKTEPVSPARVGLKIVGNPVISSSFLGILFSLSGISLHPVVGRSLDILGGMALPLALLIIGGSLDLKSLGRGFGWLGVNAVLKLLILPGMGLLFFRLVGLEAQQYLPALILLAAPTATVVYVLTAEMRGDKQLAVSAITLSTLMSGGTYILWLSLAG